ncbi:MAG: amino acid ABC transporter substrate-binding protein [bacterium]|nr:amino acid ABC transporter substrate-binding protein [bacterium]
MRSRIKIIPVLLFLALSVSLMAKNFAPDQVYRSILLKKELRVGISKDYRPLNFNNGERGVEINMARKLGEFLGAKIQLVPLDFADYLPAIEQNRVDIVIAGMSKNLEKAKRIWFSKAYFNITPAVLANKKILPRTRFGDEFEQRTIRTIWDLKHLNSFKFAIKKGSAYEAILNEKFPNMPKRIVATNQEGLDLLDKGEVHGFVHDSLYLQYLYRNTSRYQSSYKLLHGGNRIEQLCIGLPFGDYLLKNQVDIFISEMIRQGYLENWLDEFNK